MEPVDDDFRQDRRECCSEQRTIGSETPCSQRVNKQTGTERASFDHEGRASPPKHIEPGKQHTRQSYGPKIKEDDRRVARRDTEGRSHSQSSEDRATVATTYPVRPARLISLLMR